MGTAPHSARTRPGSEGGVRRPAPSSRIASGRSRGVNPRPTARKSGGPMVRGYDSPTAPPCTCAGSLARADRCAKVHRKGLGRCMATDYFLPNPAPRPYAGAGRAACVACPRCEACGVGRSSRPTTCRESRASQFTGERHSPSIASLALAIHIRVAFGGVDILTGKNIFGARRADEMLAGGM